MLDDIISGLEGDEDSGDVSTEHQQVTSKENGNASEEACNAVGVAEWVMVRWTLMHELAYWQYTS